MRTFARVRQFAAVLLTIGSSSALAAQTPPSAPPETPPQTAAPAPLQPESRTETIERAQSEKTQSLHAYEPNKAEQIFQKFDSLLLRGTLRWHPFFDSAYSGGGFTLGIGHVSYLSGYNFLDVRGSYTVKDYKRIEAEFVAPRLFNRRGHLSVTGGWREATQVGFYGIGTNSSNDNRTNYQFRQPYGSALLTVYPTRHYFMLRGGLELSQWSQQPGSGSAPSVETRYTAEELPGLGANVTYLHTQGTVGYDWRPSPGYARRGGFYGVTLHDYHDPDDQFGFHMVEYEAIQHVPILREAWVLSFRGRLQTAIDAGNQQTPFFMLPALGGGSTLRGFSSWRFRDKNALLLQGEWRVMVNRYIDLAFFYDAGKVTAYRSDLDLNHLKDDAGVGVRFHGPFATPLRIEVAKSHDGLQIVFAASPVF
jgi:hypothetical protein